MLLNEIELWLRSIQITAIERLDEINDDEANAITKIVRLKEDIKNLKEKERKLSAIKAKCDELSEFDDVSGLSKALSEQLTITIEILREQLRLSIAQIDIFEQYLRQMRERPIPTPSQADETIGSSPMPEDEVVAMKPIEAETQTSVRFELERPTTTTVEQQTSFPLETIRPETLDMSVQTTKEKKPSENIHVTQTFSEGHETIKIESQPNPEATTTVEDVFVDAKYQQPGEPKRSSELVLRNVPAESFETTFVEPDETTTEVVVDADGTKRIIVRKLTRTRQQIVHQQQQQQFTTISSLVGEDAVPVAQAVTQLNIENQTSTTTLANADGAKTTTTSQLRGSLAVGDSPDNLIVQETFETQPQIEEIGSLPTSNVRTEIVETAQIPSTSGQAQPTSIQTVTQHVTRRVIRTKRRIIRRVVIIDGVEHVTEEVIEEPDEVVITEEESPNVNVNIVQQPIVQLAPDDAQKTTIEQIVVHDVVDVQPERQKKSGKEAQIDVEKQVKDEHDGQVQSIDTAPVVELNIVDNAPVVDEEITNVSIPADDSSATVNVVYEPAQNQQSTTEQQIVIQSPAIENIDEIWPPSQLLPPAIATELHAIESVEPSSAAQVTQQDTIASTDIWPIDVKTGTPFEIEKYQFEVEPKSIVEELPATPAISAEEVIVAQLKTPEVIEASIIENVPEAIEPSPALLQPQIDVRSATQTFIEHELKLSDPTSRVVKVSLPGATPSQSPGSVTVTMKVEPEDEEQPKLQVNIVEESQVVQPATSTPSIDPSVVESVELNIDEDKTISEKMEMPEIETTPVQESDDSSKKRKKNKKKKKKKSSDTSDSDSANKVLAEKESIVSPDGTYKSIETPSEIGEVKIIEETVITSPTESAPPIGAQLVVTTEVIEATAVDDVEQQTSPVQIGEVATPLAQVSTETREQQTSPDQKPIRIEIAQQTTPEPSIEHAEQENQTELHVTDIDVQTSPLPQTSDEPKAPVQMTSEEIQTDDVPATSVAEVSVQTTQITTKEQQLQTSPAKEKTAVVVDVSDVVPTVAAKLVADIISDIPIQIAQATEATNTEPIVTTETVTQITDEERPKTETAETTAAAEPIEIQVQTTFTMPEQASGDVKPTQVEITKTVVIEVDTDKDKKKKNKKKKNKKGKGDDFGASKSDETAKFLEQERGISQPKEIVAVTEEEQPTQASIEITEIDSSKLPSEEIEVEPTKVSKPTIVQLDITKKSVYDTINMDQRQKKSPTTPGSSGSKQVTSTVKIEEVLPSEDQVDVPLTPGLDRAEQYERQPEAVWSTKIISSHQSDQTPSSPSESVWDSANVTITDRIRNTNNNRNAHLSNVLHLATLSDIAAQPLEHRLETARLNIHQLKQAIERREIDIIQRTIVTTIETISTWLETVEYRVYLNRQNSDEGPSDEKIAELNELNNELKVIGKTINELSQTMNRASELVTPDESERMAACFANLQQQVKAVETVTRENGEQTANDLRRWTEYVTIVETIITTINEMQDTFETISTEVSSIDQQLNRLDALDQQNRTQIAEIGTALSTARSLTRDFPGKSLPQDIHATYENARALENAISLERQRLLQLQSLGFEYERTLNEFVNIVALAEALVEQPITASSLDQLQQEMQKHRKFFITFDHCRTILESLEENVDNDTRVRNAELHHSLHEKALQIIEKAGERAQRISLAASRWTVLEKGMRDERQWLQVAQQRVPDLSAVTSADYERYVSLYQSLSADIANHHAKIVHLINIADQLQTLVDAPHLAEENNDSLIILLQLRDEVTNYLRRLTAFRDTWTTYEQLTDRLELWMKQAEKDLQKIEVPKDLRTQPIENMRQFWEIKVHYEVNNNQRKEISENFEKSIENVPIADEVLQRQFHAQLEDRWFKLSDRIQNIQDAIVNSLSDQDLPLDEKLALLKRELEEIQSNVSSVKSVIKNADELNLYIERMQVLKSRIGIICNELGRVGILPSTEPEQVGKLFALAHKVSTQINEELENANVLRDQLVAIKHGIRRMQQIQKSTAIALDECEAKEKLGSEQIEMAIADCQHIGNELQLQWQEIMRLRQLLHTLPMRLRVSVSPVKVERDLSQLQDDHAVLESRCANIAAILKHRLALWRRFERQLEIVQQSSSETDYMVDLLKVNGQVDYERLMKATERLEVSTFSFYSFCF